MYSLKRKSARGALVTRSDGSTFRTGGSSGFILCKDNKPFTTNPIPKPEALKLIKQLEEENS